MKAYNIIWPTISAALFVLPKQTMPVEQSLNPKSATQLNVYKINIGAALINGFVDALTEGAALPPAHDPKHQVILRHVIERLREIARTRLSLFGASSHGKKLLQELIVAQCDLPDRIEITKR